MDSDVALQLFGDLANIIGSLHPAAQLVNEIIKLLGKVSHNRSRCKVVCTRVQRIVYAINGNLRSRSTITLTPSEDHAITRLVK